MIRFTIPYPATKKGKAAFCKRFGLNAYYSGKHWAQRKRDADELHMLARSAMNRAHVKRQPLEKPVEIRFYWDDGLDVDNHAVIGKAIVDAMKKAVIENDDRRYVEKISHEFWDGGEILVEVKERYSDGSN